MNSYVNIDDLIERALIMVSNHQLFRHPIVRNKAGNPVRITRVRDDNGFDDNQDGLTLGIYPYSYGNGSTTVQSGNAALVYEHYHVGSGTNSPGFDRCRVHLKVKLSALDQDRSETLETFDGYNIVFLRNEVERSLRKWMEVIRTILLTNPINNLSGLVRNSHVNNITFGTSEWTGRSGKNAVLHEAELTWQLELNAPRNWKTWPIYNPLDGVNTWTYIGVELRTEKPIYFDSGSQQLVYVDGFPLTVTPPPANIPVKWDPIENRLEKVDGTPLTALELIDPATGKDWIVTTLKLIGVIKPDKNLYWNTVSKQLELADGTLITQLDGPDETLGTVDDIGVTYDEETEVLYLTYPNEDPRPVNPTTDPIYLLNTSQVSIYDANGMILKESFRI